VAPSSQSNVARYTLGEDEESNTRLEPKENPYFNNKPD
jgi:hypothetical protein